MSDPQLAKVVQACLDAKQRSKPQQQARHIVLSRRCLFGQLGFASFFCVAHPATHRYGRVSIALQ
jgi:hypothetical protein